jgi:hypothetical protein
VLGAALLALQELFPVSQLYLKNSNLMEDKQKLQIKHKPQFFLNTQRCCQNYTIPTCYHPF